MNYKITAPWLIAGAMALVAGVYPDRVTVVFLWILTGLFVIEGVRALFAKTSRY